MVYVNNFKTNLHRGEECEYNILDALAKNCATMTEIHENFHISKMSLVKYLGKKNKDGFLILNGLVERVGNWRYQLTIDGESRRLFLQNKHLFQKNESMDKPNQIKLEKKKADVTAMLKFPKNTKSEDKERIINEFKEKVYPLMAEISNGINIQVTANTVFNITGIGKNIAVSKNQKECS